jgi:phosphoserine phosphatase
VDDPARGRPLTGPGGEVPSETATTAVPVPDGLDATLVLVRHGESQYIVEGRFQGQSDTPLTPRGRRQAELVGRRLATPHAPPPLPLPDGPPREIVHSPLARTRETAEGIGRVASRPDTALPLRADPGFLEIGQGAWEGLHRDEIARRFGAELAGWRRAPTRTWAPGGESLAAVAERVRPALEAVLETLAVGSVPGTLDRNQVAGYETEATTHPWTIVVGHDGVFKIALLTLFDLPLDRFWMWSMDLGAITIVEIRAGRAVLRAHNLTEHLAPILDERSAETQEERSRSGAL